MIIHLNEGKLFSDKALNYLKKVGVISSTPLKNLSISKKKKIEILFIKLRYKIDKNYLKYFTNLKFIVSPTTSVTHVDLKFCKQKNIKIIKLDQTDLNLKKVFSTAELTLGLILSLKRNIHKSFYDSKFKKNVSRYDYIGKSLNGLTIGIIGFGRIGKMVAKISRAFNLKIIIYDKLRFKKLPKYIRQVEKLDEIFENADIISIHMSPSDSNIDLINKNLLNKCLKKPIIINTSREVFINEVDLINSLKKGVISGIGLDVNKGEYEKDKIFDLIKSNPKLNILLTPHIGGCTIDEMKTTEEIVSKKLLLKLKK